MQATGQEVLLYSDLEEEASISRAATQGPPKDHCDLLLNTIDAHLSCLHAQSHRGDNKNCRRTDYSNGGLFCQSRSESKDTGLGSTIVTSDAPISPLNMVFAGTEDISSEKVAGNRNPMLTGDDKEDEQENRREGTAGWGSEMGEECWAEQCRWRLGRLLGNTMAGLGTVTPHRADSIRTEDFAAQFNQEMVDLLAHMDHGAEDLGNRNSGEHQVQNPGGKSWRYEELPATDPFRPDPLYDPTATKAKGVGVELEAVCGLGVPFGQSRCGVSLYSPITPTEGDQQQSRGIDHAAGARDPSRLCSRMGGSGEDVGTPLGHPLGVTADLSTDRGMQNWRPKASCQVSDLPCNPLPSPFHHSHSSPRDSDTSVCPPPTGARNRERAKPVCNSGGQSGILSRRVSAPGPHRGCDTGWSIVSECSPNTTGAKDDSDSTLHSRVRRLAGIPVRCFDSVTIDSDLDSVHTERVREHLQQAFSSVAGKGVVAAIQPSDLSSDQSDRDTQAKFSLWRSGEGGVPSRNRPVRKPQPTKKGHSSAKMRHMCSGGEESDETEREEIKLSSWQIRSEKSPKRLSRWNSAPLRRESSPGSGVHRRLLEENQLNSDRLLLEETLSALRRDCVREEKRLGERRAQVCETKECLTALLQQKKRAVQELEAVQATVEQARREEQGLEVNLRDSRAQVDTARSQLRTLQCQKDSCLKEVRGLDAELVSLHSQQKGLHKKQNASRLTVLERDELDRQLEVAKTELFAEQRRARHKLDSMQEKLEEAQQELDQQVEERRTLRRRCTVLEDELRNLQNQKQRSAEGAQTMEVRLQELKGALKEQEDRAGSLEHILAQKELLLLEARGVQTSLQAEGREELQVAREGQQAELQSLREELNSMKKTQEQAKRDKERELEQLRTELSSFREQQVQQLKEEELRKLKEALEQQAEELRAEARDKVQQAIDRQQKVWEVGKKDELERQREILEEQSQQVVGRLKEETAREKRSALALQNKVVELQTRVQELENEARLQQQELTAALAAQRRALMEEQQTELQQLRRHLEQVGQKEVLRLQEAVQRAEGETRALQEALEERLRNQEETVLRLDQQQKTWAVELGAECQRLHELLKHNGAAGGCILPQGRSSSTVAQAVQTLRTVGEQLHILVTHLQQEVDSQRCATQQLAREKEQELQIQREQLRAEKEQAMGSLRQRLVEDHIKEVSSLQRTQLHQTVSEAGGSAMSLQRLLRDKDAELRDVQRSMGIWKERTTARLARKFGEELTAELERCKAELLKKRRARRAREEQWGKLQCLENEMRQLTMEYGAPGGLRSASSPSLCSVDPPASSGTPDLATLKLLRHLQSRVRQLRAERWGYTCSSTQSGAARELAGSYLEKRAPPMESCPTRSLFSIRTLQS